MREKGKRRIRQYKSKEAPFSSIGNKFSENMKVG
jgi:hypothetical protein